MKCSQESTVPSLKLIKEGSGPELNTTALKQLVGSLRYLTATRSDLICSVNLIRRYMERSKEPTSASS